MVNPKPSHYDGWERPAEADALTVTANIHQVLTTPPGTWPSECSSIQCLRDTSQIHGYCRRRKRRLRRTHCLSEVFMLVSGSEDLEPGSLNPRPVLNLC